MLRILLRLLVLVVPLAQRVGHFSKCQIWMSAPLSDSFPYISMSVFPQMITRAGCPLYNPTKSPMFVWQVSLYLTRDRLGAELELDRMGDTSGFGSGSRLLEWWSSGRAEVFQLGSVADSCKKVRSGRVSALPAPGRPYDRRRPHTCARLASRVGSTTSVG
ncbi:hypothetical protein B296_00059002 [Ensete ventricosum]|uniref:Secreted protein n=1 Tax=Ensete ventricosum TaxID=4639 RepID=A0A426WXF7_ENSVE|nr:hypothetical protein B296_00059002 [Ensete ventricosum]